jgi:predicted dehydrogenase
MISADNKLNSLIVGLGIGQLYKNVFLELEYNVDTVDTDVEKNATYGNIQEVTKQYDIAVICTPNFTHEAIARNIADKCKIVLIEKPGVKDSNAWAQLVKDFPKTRFMMIKNNQYREEIELFRSQCERSNKISIQWNNSNRIPYPGSWFTTKALAYGGVSRDLIPHMLSYYCILADYSKVAPVKSDSKQHYNLSDIFSTDYGTVNSNGTYDVDDYSYIQFNNNKEWNISANWKTNLNRDNCSITFFTDTSESSYMLGLCPESAYKTMVSTAINNLNNNKFWEEQLSQDIWIHQQIENL